MEPGDLINLKNSYTNKDAENLLDKFRDDPDTGIPESCKLQIIYSVRGLFRANYCDLAKEAGKMQIEQSKKTQKPTMDQRLKAFQYCTNPRDQTIVMLSTCTAIARETLIKLKWSHFDENWTEQEIPHISIPSDLIKGHGKGKYRGTRQETFLTPEAKKVLLEYRQWLTRHFHLKITPDSPVLVQIKHNIGAPLNSAALAIFSVRLSAASGVHFSIHDGRRIVQTALENVGCPQNWIKKIKGRKCRSEEAPYSRPAIEQLRAKYREALPELEFLTQTAPVNNSSIEKVKAEKFALEKKIAKLEAAITEIRDAMGIVEKIYKAKDTFEPFITVKGDRQYLLSTTTNT